MPSTKKMLPNKKKVTGSARARISVKKTREGKHKSSTFFTWKN